MATLKVVNKKNTPKKNIPKKDTPKKDTPKKEKSGGKEYANLDEVMDYTRDFKMFYSGVEYEVYLDGCYQMGVRDFLMSYEYLKNKGNSILKKYPDIHLFIDSGAFTYLTDAKYELYTIKQWEDQIKKYLKWAKSHKEYIFAIAELDLTKMVGLEVVERWRRELFEPFMLETGVPVCFIYHNEGMDLWEKMCQRYPYVGFSAVSDIGKTRNLDDYLQLLKVAEKYNSVVHGFGMTRTSILPKLPFYTSDSSVDGASNVRIETKWGLKELTIKDLFDSFPKAMVKQTSPTEYVIDTTETGMKTLTTTDSQYVVTEALKAIVKHIVKKPTIKITDIKGNSVTCTTDHSVITLKDNKLVETKADELRVGDNLITHDLDYFPYYTEETEIKSIEIINDGSKEVEVYDLSVDKYERFIANNVLVHNTSWKAGFRYGLISVWNGVKVLQYKTDKWEEKLLPSLNSYKDIKLDHDLLMEYNEPEVLRASVYAFLKAEEYIIFRLKSLMYWKKIKAVKVDMNNLPDDFFPPLKWFKDNSNDDSYKDYAKKMNINAEYVPEAVRVCIMDMTYFVNYGLNTTYSNFKDQYTDDVIAGMHNELINRVVPDVKTMVDDLKTFFTNCLKGENDTLLNMGTNFDRIVKERDSYLEEETHEEVEVDLKELEEIQKTLTIQLTNGSENPEIAELDKEIFGSTGIQVYRDEKGQILKGVSIKRLHKNVYSEKYPKYACDTCYVAQKCPEYKAGYVCAYNKLFKRFDSRNMADIINGMQGILDHNMARMQRSMIMEVMNGAVADPVVSDLMQQNLNIMTQIKQMYDYAGSEVLKQTHVIRPDGSQEKNTFIQNPQSGGILEKLFSSSNNEKPEKSEGEKFDEDDIIDAEVEEIEEEKEEKKEEEKKTKDE